MIEILNILKFYQRRIPLPTAEKSASVSGSIGRTSARSASFLSAKLIISEKLLISSLENE